MRSRSALLNSKLGTIDHSSAFCCGSSFTKPLKLLLQIIERRDVRLDRAERKRPGLERLSALGAGLGAGHWAQTRRCWPLVADRLSLTAWAADRLDAEEHTEAGRRFNAGNTYCVRASRHHVGRFELRERERETGRGASARRAPLRAQPRKCPPRNDRAAPFSAASLAGAVLEWLSSVDRVAGSTPTPCRHRLYARAGNRAPSARRARRCRRNARSQHN